MADYLLTTASSPIQIYATNRNWGRDGCVNHLHGIHQSQHHTGPEHRTGTEKERDRNINTSESQITSKIANSIDHTVHCPIGHRVSSDSKMKY